MVWGLGFRVKEIRIKVQGLRLWEVNLFFWWYYNPNIIPKDNLSLPRALEK